MSSSQKRAIQNYRARLGKRGMARFEVLGLDIDRDLIRSLARRLAEEGMEASHLRTVVSQTLAGESPRRGGILAALRRSPLVGTDLDFIRSMKQGAMSNSDALSPRHQHHQHHHETNPVQIPGRLDGRADR